MHQWLFDNRILVLLLCMAGFGYSGFLYYRAYNAWQAKKSQPKTKRRSMAGSKARLAAKQQGGKEPGPLPRTTSINGEQADLLDAMDQKSTVGDTKHHQKGYQSTHIIRQPKGDLLEPSRDTGPRPSEIIRQLQDREPAKDILDQIEAAAEAEALEDEQAAEASPAASDSESFSTTEKFRTTRQLQATHDADEAEAAEDEDTSDKPVPLGERETVRNIAPAWLTDQEAARSLKLPEPPPGLSEKEKDAWREEHRRLRDLAAEGRRTSEPLPQEPGADKAIHRGYVPPQQAAQSALDKARRLEELGLHHSISAAAKAAQVDAEAQRENSAIADDLDAQQRKRLSELGLTDAGDESDADAQDPKRLVTAELNGILARLDAALDPDENLADDEADDNDTATADVSAEHEPSAIDQSIGDALDQALGDDDDNDLASTLDQVLGDDDALDSSDDDDSAPAVDTKVANDLPSWARVDTFDDEVSDTKAGDDDEEPPAEPKQRSLFD